MNKVFQPYLRKFVLFSFNDILVYNRTLKDHVGHLELVLKELQKHQLYANQKKCLFAQINVEYLGHVVLAKGVSADQSKIAAILNWPQP